MSYLAFELLLVSSFKVMKGISNSQPNIFSVLIQKILNLIINDFIYLMSLKNISKSLQVGVSGLVFDMAPPGRVNISFNYFYVDSFLMKKILLIKREQEPYFNKWSFPGGHLEYGKKI